MKYFIWTGTVLAIIASFMFDKQKTIKALKIAGRRLLKIAPLFFYVMGLTSIVMAVIPSQTIQKVLGSDSGGRGVLLAAGLGSVTMMPGFVAFPLAAMLKAQGVTYMVLSAFTMTLMNVGVLTFPLEKSYLGARVAIIRNVIGLILAGIVTLIIAIVFGEVFI